MRNKVLLLFLLFPVLTGATQGLDVVVMIDTSESMFPYFEELVHYLIGDLLENRLHVGDHFHLLSFANAPETEISETIEDSDNVEKLLDRILILKALGQYTDLVWAIDYLYNFTRALPEREKYVLLLTDGIHDPPPGSPNLLEKQDLVKTVLARAQKIKMEGWSIHILQTPRPPGAPPSGTTATKPSGPGEDILSGQELLKDFARGLEIEVTPYAQGETLELKLKSVLGPLRFEFPIYLGEVKQRFQATFTVYNPTSLSKRLRIVALDSKDNDLLVKDKTVQVDANGEREFTLAIRLPTSLTTGEHTLPVRLLYTGTDPADGDQRISSTKGTLHLTYKPGESHLVYLFYALAVLLALVLLYLLYRLIRWGLYALSIPSFKRIFHRESNQHLLLMRVSFQNPNIGLRNVHPVAPKSSKTVGGRGSNFLIYYVPVPRRIGEIHNDGSKYIFVPKRTRYFPDLDGPLPDCLGREILAYSTRGHLITFEFTEYVSPLEKINRLMLSIRHAADEPTKDD